MLSRVREWLTRLGDDLSLWPGNQGLSLPVDTLDEHVSGLVIAGLHRGAAAVAGAPEPAQHRVKVSERGHWSQALWSEKDTREAAAVILLARLLSGH